MTNLIEMMYIRYIREKDDIRYIREIYIYIGFNY